MYAMFSLISHCKRYREASVCDRVKMGKHHQEPPKPRLVLLGAGLPRNGTLSTRAALRQLLRGDVYHMLTVMQERHDHHPLWEQALDKTITK